MPLINYSILIRQSDNFSSYCCKRCLHKLPFPIAVILSHIFTIFLWPVYCSMIALTVITSFAGAWISMRILKKHFEKAGMV
ncbi:MptD family putative ECF transporter S component [Treponema vincentii]|uniref:MptD family putative ECF transporter S component n=1 Tax=Treponema vincentii TaxID=69710 RepID=UPI0035F578DD